VSPATHRDPRTPFYLSGSARCLSSIRGRLSCSPFVVGPGQADNPTLDPSTRSGLQSVVDLLILLCCSPFWRFVLSLRSNLNWSRPGLFRCGLDTISWCISPSSGLHGFGAPHPFDLHCLLCGFCELLQQGCRRPLSATRLWRRSGEHSGDSELLLVVCGTFIAKVIALFGHINCCRFTAY
jgi:hypothetical protein